jgi:hypothetical protein
MAKKNFECDIVVNGKVTADKVGMSKIEALMPQAVGNVAGEVAYFGSGTGLVAGNIYYLSTTGYWTLANASAATSSIGLLGIALGTDITQGVLLRGLARFNSTHYVSATVGQMLFLSTTAGTFSGTAPTGTTKVVRVIGQCLDATLDVIYFCPDNTWVELS